MDEKGTILVVDDEELIKKTLIDVLVSEYEVICACNGREALDLLKENVDKITAIVLDLIMPVMDGFQFMDEFRLHKEYDNIPVIVATSNEDWHSEKKCLEAGVWDFVMKPYNPELLMFRIRNAMDKSRMIMSERDTLTGLHTKFKFYREVRRLFIESEEEKFAFVRIDIDRFKMINNFYGIKEGDKVLTSVANELKRIATAFEHFTCGRIENDVFGVCLPYNEQNIDLLVKALQINMRKVNKDYNIKVSCGVYIIKDRTMDVSEMYDRAFLAAKNCKGRFVDNVAYYDDSMIENMRQEQFIINEVNKAIEEEQFEVFLQPKINLVTDKSYGAEALVRWRHPDRGMISPAEFVPVYERNGIIGRLDQYMWRRVCMLLRKWIDEGKKPNPISVNVSRVNIYNPHLVEILKNLITEYKIPAALLNLELTESAFMEDQALVMKTMNRLHNIGFKIMMDDFGSGYSSLNVLKDMDVDYLKVDMKFLQQDSKFNNRGEKVITSVIRMAKWMHLPSIVEGVETLEQVDFLKCIGCEYAQGFFYARPMPVKEYEEFLLKEEKNTTAQYTNENEDIIGELWNARSNTSLFFDMLDVPIAIYEYRNDNIELLRSNPRYDNEIAFEKGIDEKEHSRRVKNERHLLKEQFGKLVKGELFGSVEYEVVTDLWYRVSIKLIGKRVDTMIIMVTFNDVSEYK